MTDSAKVTKVHPTALVDEHAELGEGVEVGPFSIIGPEARIGAGTKLHGHVQVLGRVSIGIENEIYGGVVLGGTPQDRSYHGEETEVVIGDRNQIRENCTIHVGTTKSDWSTRVGSDNLIMCGCHVAHDCNVGSHVTIGNNTLLAGHVAVEDGVMISGGVGVHHWATIGRLAFVGALTRITVDAPPFMIIEGRPGRVRSLNLVGLERSGLDRSSVTELREAYKVLYHLNETQGAGIKAVTTSRLIENPEVAYLVEALRRQDAGYKGRWLEAAQRERLRGAADDVGRRIY